MTRDILTFCSYGKLLRNLLNSSSKLARFISANDNMALWVTRYFITKKFR